MRAKVSAACVPDTSLVQQAAKIEHRPVKFGPLPTAWDGREDSSCSNVLVEQSLVPYSMREPCYLSLRSADLGTFFVSARLGSLLFNDVISKTESSKVVGDFNDGVFECVLTNLPLQRLANESPIGLVACKFKVWAQSRIARRWIGCTLPLPVPLQSRIMRIGDVDLVVAVQRGVAAEDAIKRGVRVVPFQELDVELFPAQDAVQVLGRHLLRLASFRQWALARAMLRELYAASEDAKRAAMAEVDTTKRSVLRLCVDGLWAEQAFLVQALEGARLTTLLGARRPYFFELRISAVCGRTCSFLGETRIGMPRSHGSALAAVRPWSAGATSFPIVGNCRWSESKPCNGTAELTSQAGRLQMEDTELSFLFVQPGEAVPLGTSSFRNPLDFAMVAVQGRIVGTIASGFFDLATCARVAGERQACGPREVAAASLACGADPHSLADDGLSPYTAALLGEDPCGLLSDLDPHLRNRLRRNDGMAWAEIGRSSTGSGHMDLVATPLTRGVVVPEDLAESLLCFCFRANLPLLAMRVLVWVDGQQHLMETLEHAEDPLWLRVAERILHQKRSATPCWCTVGTLPYALEQIRAGRLQFQLFLKAFLEQVRSRHQDFFAHPVALIGNGAECSICFEPLCRNTPVAFTENGRAVCPHFLCSGCARDYAASANDSRSNLRCPECRRQGTEVTNIPKISEDPLAWFNFLASEEDTVNRRMLLRAVSAMLPADVEQLASAMGESLLSSAPEAQEIPAARFLTDGLYAWIQRHEEEHRRCLSKGPVPSMSHRADWFRYWDFSESGYLSQGEVLRAMLRILQISSLDGQRVEICRRRVDRLWEHCASERKKRYGHSSCQGIACQEFCDVGGLGDLLTGAFEDAQLLNDCALEIDEPMHAAAAASDSARFSESSATGAGSARSSSSSRRRSVREGRHEEPPVLSEQSAVAAAAVQAAPRRRRPSKEAWGVPSSVPSREATTEDSPGWTPATVNSPAQVPHVAAVAPDSAPRSPSESSLSGSDMEPLPRRERSVQVPRSETRKRRNKHEHINDEALQAVVASIPSWLSELSEPSSSSSSRSFNHGTGDPDEAAVAGAQPPHIIALDEGDSTAGRDGMPPSPGSASFGFVQLFDLVRRSIVDFAGTQPSETRTEPIVISI